MHNLNFGQKNNDHTHCIILLYQNVAAINYRGGGLFMGKITLGKILSEISGQYFFRLFKARDRNFPPVFKKS